MNKTFQVEIEPRFSETDALGHINNTVIPVWFEVGREPIFKLFNPELDIKTWNLIVAGFSIQFIAPTYHGSTVVVKTQICRVGNSSFDLKQQCFQQQKLTAEAITTLRLPFS